MKRNSIGKNKRFEQTLAQESPRLACADDFPLTGKPIPKTDQARKTRLPLDKFGRRLK